MNKAAIEFAIEYYKENRGHIWDLVSTTYNRVQPIDIQLESWKGAHWRWFMSKYIREDWQKVSCAEFGVKFGMSPETAHRFLGKKEDTDEDNGDSR